MLRIIGFELIFELILRNGRLNILLSLTILPEESSKTIIILYIFDSL